MHSIQSQNSNPNTNNQQSLVSISQLSPSDVTLLLRAANKFSEIKTTALLNDKTIAHLFFENSTRTKVSFDAAANRLGAKIISFSASQSSTKKGESLLDTAKTILAVGCDAFVIRHSNSGSAEFLSQNVAVPVINAGDGIHEHPTQALLDLMTIEQKCGSISGKTVMIIGDIVNSRVAHSNIKLLKMMGAKIILCAPNSLLPQTKTDSQILFTTNLNEHLPKADVVMTLRIQMERDSATLFPSLSEYVQFWGLKTEHLKLMKKNVVLCHPGPMNRDVEISSELVDHPSSIIFKQKHNGVWMRMAVLSFLCAKEKLISFLDNGVTS